MGVRLKRRVCRRGERQSNKLRVPETGDLVREGKRVQAPRLAELTSLQGRGGVLLLCSHIHLSTPTGCPWLP